MKKTLSILFLLLLALQCNYKKESFDEFKIKQKISFNEIVYPELLGETMQLVKTDNYLLINDYFGDSLLHIFNLNTNNIERKIVSKGIGPNEAIPPLDVKLADEFLYILSRPTYSLYRLELNSLIQDSMLLHKDMQLPSSIDCFVALGNSKFVLSGFWDKRYAYLDLTKDQELRTFGEFPDFWNEEKDLSTDIKAFFHQCRFAKHPNKNLFASCSGYVLEVFEFDPTGDKLPNLLFKKQLGKYKYKYIEGEWISTETEEDSDPKAIEIACSEDYLYIVFTTKENGCYINVLNWNGKPVKQFLSSHMINCLSIDEEEKKAYCIVKDPEDKLVYFEMDN